MSTVGVEKASAGKPAVLPLLFEYPEDPEWGFFERTNEDGETCAFPCDDCGQAGEIVVAPLGLAPWDEAPAHTCPTCRGHKWVSVEDAPCRPARCTTCEIPIPADATYPLCAKHDRTHRAHGRLDAERQRQERGAA